MLEQQDEERSGLHWEPNKVDFQSTSISFKNHFPMYYILNAFSVNTQWPLVGQVFPFVCEFLVFHLKFTSIIRIFLTLKRL